MKGNLQMGIDHGNLLDFFELRDEVSTVLSYETNGDQA